MIDPEHMFVLSLLAVVGAALWMRARAGRAALGSKVEGEVVEQIEEATGDGRVWRIRVCYTASDGRSAYCRGAVAANPPTHAIGEKVTVLLTPGRPAEVLSHAEFELAPKIVLGAGLVGCVVYGAQLIGGR